MLIYKIAHLLFLSNFFNFFVDTSKICYTICHAGRQREQPKRVKIMKKIVLLSLCCALVSNIASADYYRTTVNNCDDANMRVALDQAASENRAVVTVVECTNVQTETETVAANTWENSYAPSYSWNYEYAYGYQPVDVVVNREYFVRETVQQYKPVVVYMPAGRYTRVKRTCKHNCDF